MDIFAFRFDLCLSVEKRMPSEECSNPILVKPSPFLSIRDIVARYARGEVVFKPEQSLETPVSDDTVKHVDSIKSNLDYAQKVVDKREYLSSLDLLENNGEEAREFDEKSAVAGSGVIEDPKGA